MKKILYIILGIFLFWILIYFFNQNIDKIITNRTFEFENLSNNSIEISIIKNNNKNSEFIKIEPKKNLSLDFNNIIINFWILNHSYIDYYKNIIDKMKKNEIYNEDNIEIIFKEQKLTISERYFPLYEKKILNQQIFVIKIKE